MESKYKKLAQNTAIFAIGSFGSKVLSSLIVPLYTYVLTTVEYGKIDLFTTSISLMLPFVTLLMQESLLRFVLGKEIRENVAVSNCWLIFVGGSALAIALFPLYKVAYGSTQLAIVFLLLLILNSFNQIFSQFLRAVGRNVAFMLDGVIITAVTLASNFTLLVGFHMGMMGYLYSAVLAQAVSAVFILFAGNLWEHISFRYCDFTLLKKMLKYSIPLIPNSMMWWIMSAGDKYIINYFLGDGANGLYSLASKLPTIVTMVYSLFFQAWQLSAIEEIGKTDEKAFYTNVYKVTNAMLMLMVTGIVLLVEPVYVLVMNEEFAPSWQYVPLLTIAMIFSCMASFFSVTYTNSMQTAKVFVTTALGAVVNIACNMLLIRPLGLHGVAIGTAVGYLVVAVIRGRASYKETGADFDLGRTIISIVLLLVQSAAVILMGGLWGYLVAVLCVLAEMFLYRKEIFMILNMVWRMVFNKKAQG